MAHSGLPMAVLKSLEMGKSDHLHKQRPSQLLDPMEVHVPHLKFTGTTEWWNKSSELQALPAPDLPFSTVVSQQINVQMLKMYTGHCFSRAHSAFIVLFHSSFMLGVPWLAAGCGFDAPASGHLFCTDPPPPIAGLLPLVAPFSLPLSF